jgi:hypothetical protein
MFESSATHSLLVSRAFVKGMKMKMRDQHGPLRQAISIHVKKKSAAAMCYHHRHGHLAQYQQPH